MPAGRPTLYRPEYCEKVIELGKDGKSVVQMACAFGVSRPTMEENWTREYPEFLEAFTLAKQYSQDWWEQKGQDNLLVPQGVTFQASVWSRSMAARFPHDWRENSKMEHTGPNGGPIEHTTTVKYIEPPTDN